MFYIIIVAGIFLLDFKIKKYIENNKKIGDSEEILGGRIILRKFHNKGAMLSFLKTKQKLVEAVSLFLTVWLSIFYVVLLFKKGYHGLKLALSFILGGALSNVYDRVTRNYVVDYFSFNTRIKQIKRVIFNISDIFIFLGSFLILIFSFFTKEE